MLPEGIIKADFTFFYDLPTRKYYFAWKLSFFARDCCVKSSLKLKAYNRLLTLDMDIDQNL